jgi:hypothetical protein
MKRAVSISLGSSELDKAVEIELLGVKVHVERIGTDGDMERPARLDQTLNGRVDAFGVGGADFGVQVANRWYPLPSVKPMVRFVRQTPIVDGSWLKSTFEAGLAPFLEAQIGPETGAHRSLITSAVDRWGMANSFLIAGYQCLFGDVMFALGIPLALQSEGATRFMAALIMPIVGRLPIQWVYPTGGKRQECTPRWGAAYHWAPVIAGDCHYVKRYMPDRLPEKIVVANTTTPADVAFFKQASIRYLATSTPVLDGRFLGTNMMEAALVAVAGKGRSLQRDELEAIIRELKMAPQLKCLN